MNNSETTTIAVFFKICSQRLIDWLTFIYSSIFNLQHVSRWRNDEEAIHFQLINSMMSNVLILAHCKHIKLMSPPLFNCLNTENNKRQLVLNIPRHDNNFISCKQNDSFYVTWACITKLLVYLTFAFFLLLLTTIRVLNLRIFPVCASSTQ